MAVDLSALASVGLTAKSLSNLILVTPQKNIGIQPMPVFNQDGSVSQDDAFIFNYEGENTITLDSDITDHFIEDNTSIQDQIALKPEMITVQGFIAELNDIPPTQIASFLKTNVEKLSSVSAYVPALSATAQIAYNTAVQAYAIAEQLKNAAVSAWDLASGVDSTVQTKQQAAYAKLYGYWKLRTLFKIQTPWAIFEDVAIKTLRVMQDAETRMITDFEITFKKINFAQTITENSIVLGQGRWNQQTGSLLDQSLTPLKPGFSLGANLGDLSSGG